jgi:hypothetical protein
VEKGKPKSETWDPRREALRAIVKHLEKLRREEV